MSWATLDYWAKAQPDVPNRPNLELGKSLHMPHSSKQVHGHWARRAQDRQGKADSKRKVVSQRKIIRLRLDVGIQLEELNWA